jgi:Ca2+-binding EF-hand superfamily protein
MSKIAERWQWLYDMGNEWTKNGTVPRERVSEVLRECGSPKNIKPLIEELSDAEEQVRQLREALNYLYRHADERLTDDELEIAENALASTELKEERL